MTQDTWRWLLAPVRQWRTRRLMARHGPALSYPTAWALITLHSCPQEVPLLCQVLREAGVRQGEGSIVPDDWRLLGARERARRSRWLRRHGCSPVRRLAIDDALIRAVGLTVTDWGPPGSGEG
ncbi:hypothetical protein [Streptomyces aidingensis]|uniref:Uncharacterized protein n=1 Tax=Streptomyces aidingensis TaxID=910347 RepID=A0A1I1TJ54_9ACTN|nr:hypothetical protein [Streptomyces aidingensis]SFD58567.1 hypothetical protein SAMN05421773_1204 [Streptomyces aidingensis]